ncbi:hypothetical protein BAUCODRAFT_118466 [Baudoinia panamericana UAMH 10762]|uniref:Ribosomal RNA-processing protein 1 n=1 Tax=Baudoinia panamericana (strain UAMH 10762) TaxID=717646 RepID=M2NMH5_BAUPA|nr:uncharacterized protein BAUCODRAFT_118466 [Baudoinia panamericana UAMH 10762]EMD00725.1 hypothetical protein BAUCODRAFT_118466 [Baudoinia panamericana UAMH 10762]
MAQQSSPFIKQLASSDRKLRLRALSSLRTYLSASRPTFFTQLDLLKLWKGLFYCLWMQDKPLHQQNLSRDLADLVDVLKGQENVLGFLEAFWVTMAREWANIDRLRMDKYLYLVRCFVRKGWEICAADRWADGELLGAYLRMLEAIPLNPRDMKVPNGLRHHVVDVYVDELEKADPNHGAPLSVMLKPLRRLEEETVTKSVRMRVREALEDERLQEWQVVDVAQPEATESAGEKAEDGAETAAPDDDDVDGDGDGDFNGFGD